LLTPDVPRFFVRLQHAGWTPSQLLEICHASERLDYDGFSLYDVPSQPALECWTALSYCLGSTNRLVGVPLVLANPLRNPALVAKAAADLQTLSGGRLVLGLGAGGSDHDLRAYGLGDLPLRRRLEWLDEALQLIRQLLTGRQHSHRGTRYAVEGLHVDLPPAPLPILVGGHGQRLLQIAARHADIVNVGFDLTPEEWYRVKNLLERRRLEGPQRDEARPLA
jgi:alkanesulfonate monooxygenase SsuD/methylene tetrahydromethanopterin reductase-like flavin-dependent oxidoreductase (luciferase family)